MMQEDFGTEATFFSNHVEKMYDLHGKSESEAQTIVHQVIRTTTDTRRTKVILVTGRGRHINKQGKRGTLFSRLPQWVKQSPYAHKVDRVETGVGHYVLYIKPCCPLLESTDDKASTEQKMTYDFQKMKQSADTGDLEAMLCYGVLLQERTAGSYNPKLGFQYFAASCKKRISCSHA